MSKVTFHDDPVNLSGSLPAVGQAAPAFSLVGGDLAEVSLASLAGKVVVLNIVPSLDTPICALSAKRFNAEASALPNTVIVNVSADLPFAQKRFCSAENLEDIVNLSTFRAPSFGKDYGVTILDSPLAGLLARAVVVVDGDGKVAYTQLVPEIGQEPDYEPVLAAVKALV